MRLQTATEAREGAGVEVTDLVLRVGLRPEAEVGAVLVVDDRENGAAHGDARFALPPSLGPRRAEHRDLLGPELVERNACVLGEKGRGHEIHALLRRPHRGGARTGAPPDAVREPRRLRLDGERLLDTGHLRVRARHADARDRLTEDRRVLVREVGVRLAVITTFCRRRGMTEEAAAAAVDQARQRLRLYTIRALMDEATEVENRETSRATAGTVQAQPV